jgi:hypothetical protein
MSQGQPSQLPWLRQWEPWEAPDHAVKVAVDICHFACTAPDYWTEKDRNALIDTQLSVTIWRDHERKHLVRYRSRGVLETTEPKDRTSNWCDLEHVHTKAWLKAKMLANPDKGSIESLLRDQACCSVTAAESKRLSRIPEGVDGWDRYRAAGIDVFDMATDPPTPFIVSEGPDT